MRSAAASSTVRRSPRQNFKGRAGKSRAAPKKKQLPIFWLPHQEFAYFTYKLDKVQLSVAALIFANFVVSAVNSQVLPQEGSVAKQSFFILETILTFIFLIELVWNMYGNACLPFWRSGWNIFDFLIVLISVLSLIFKGLPAFNVLRLFRAFRVFRLFKRIKSLRCIIEGVFAAMPGVTNAFMVLAILMGIWSIMGVEFFGEVAEEEFGNFACAMFTMFQVMTMDSWSSGIARKLIFSEKLNDVQRSIVAPIFFVLYIFIAGIVMTNVVVAILLEKYLSATQKHAQLKRADARKKARSDKEIRGPPRGDKGSFVEKNTTEAKPKSSKAASRWKKAGKFAKVISRIKIEAKKSAEISSAKELEKKRAREKKEIAAMKKMMANREAKRRRTTGRMMGPRRRSRLSMNMQQFSMQRSNSNNSRVSPETTASKQSSVVELELFSKRSGADSPLRAGSHTAIPITSHNSQSENAKTSAVTSTSPEQSRKSMVPFHQTCDLSVTSPAGAGPQGGGFRQRQEPQPMAPKALHTFLQQMIDGDCVSYNTLLGVAVRMACDGNVDPQRVPKDLAHYIRQRAIQMEDEEEMYMREVDEEGMRESYDDSPESSLLSLIGGGGGGGVDEAWD